jgi:hypothetical protein
MPKTIELLIASIADLISKLKKHYDGERKHLETLQILFNHLGDPGVPFADDKDNYLFFDNGRSRDFYRLKFEKGQLLLDKIKGENDWSTIKFSAIPINMIARTLGRLPLFLELYQEFLEKMEKTHEANFNQLAKIVETITEILNTK